MSIIDNENEIMNNFFFNCADESFLLSSINDMNDNTNDPINESKEEPQAKQQIKFILTKQNPPHETNFLQKKTASHINGLEQDSNDSNNGRWDKEEQKRFAEAVLKYGIDWKKIQTHVFSRNITQVRSHAQKFLMKLKENELLTNKGLEKNLSWTKVIIYLNSTLSYDELKEVLFSVEQTGQKKNGKKNMKKAKKNINLDKNFEKSENLSDDSGSNLNSETNNSSLLCFENEMIENNFINIDEEIKHKNVEEKEKEMLQKFIECFNPTSNNIALNTSFEENSYKEDDNNGVYQYLCDSKVKFNHKYDIF
jgi:SHAQKYF class myb-like DNA-binding protein